MYLSLGLLLRLQVPDILHEIAAAEHVAQPTVPEGGVRREDPCMLQLWLQLQLQLQL